jgi:hypothetical protein
MLARILALMMAVAIYIPLTTAAGRGLLLQNKLPVAIAALLGAAFALWLGIRDQVAQSRGRQNAGALRFAFRQLLESDKYTARVAAFLFACFAPIILLLGGK